MIRKGVINAIYHTVKIIVSDFNLRYEITVPGRANALR